jgi:S1-C subfamily serine protease
VTLGILRDGTVEQVPVTLSDLPPGVSYGTFLGGAGVTKPVIPPDALVNFGLHVPALSLELRAQYHLDAQQLGTVITGVAVGSTAADSGINAESVIMRIRDTRVASPDDFLQAIDKERTQKRSFVQRRGKGPGATGSVVLGARADRNERLRPITALGERALIVGTFVGTHEHRETNLMKYQYNR